MKTRTLKNGNIKVWYDGEDDFMIIRKGEPLYDTLIDGNLLTKKYSRILVKNIKEAGFDPIHGVFIEIDDTYQDRLESLPKEEIDEMLDSFYSHFGINYNYIEDENEHIRLLFGKFEDYEEFVKSYFGTFLLKMVAFKVNIFLSEKNDAVLVGLSDLIKKFVPEYFKKYLDLSKRMQFDNLIQGKSKI
ncbi:MAG TPA: hypothetical protein PLL94_10795 [Bacteroidales bacterium]|nr:hypothetical protein [Bacteroidales bacterium]HQK68622.1 hypothetical protein [Bacteroidales bacterium]